MKPANQQRSAIHDEVTKSLAVSPSFHSIFHIGRNFALENIFQTDPVQNSATTKFVCKNQITQIDQYNKLNRSRRKVKKPENHPGRKRAKLDQKFQRRPGTGLRSNMAVQIDQNAAEELLPFLSLDARGDVKALALDYTLGLSGSESGKKFLYENEEYLRRLLDLTRDSNPNICRDAYSAVVNLSAEQVISEKLLKYNIVKSFLSYALNQTSEHADKVAMILSNVTRTESGSTEVFSVTKTSEDCSLYRIVEVLCKENYNPHAKLNYLATFISNLTQIQESRDYILDKDRCVIQRLLPFTTYSGSLVKRAGIVGVLKNCCFETSEL